MLNESKKAVTKVAIETDIYDLRTISVSKCMIIFVTLIILLFT